MQMDGMHERAWVHVHEMINVSFTLISMPGELMHPHAEWNEGEHNK